MLIHVERELYRGGYALHLAEEQGSRVNVYGPVTVVSTDRNAAMAEPMLRLSEEDAAQLMDALWRAGVRPSDVGSPGQLAATQKHLEDMRTLVFAKHGAN
jgi:hypothetical protein